MIIQQLSNTAIRLHAEGVARRGSSWLRRGMGVLLFLLLTLTSCNDIDGPQSLPPAVGILPADSISRTSARLHGTVMANGTGSIEQLYFVYSALPDVTHAVKLNCYQEGTYEYYADMTGLTPGTDYYYQLCAGNSLSTVTSDIGMFSTLHNSKPHLADLAVLSQGPLSIICSYGITDDGGCPVTETGYYVRSQDGTTNKVPVTLPDNQDLGRILVHVDNLIPQHSYSLSAYAVNAEGETQTEAIPIITGDAIVLGGADQLAELLNDETMEYYAANGCHFNIAGTLNGNDIFALRSALDRFSAQGNGWDINLADASIVHGGRAYGYGRFTEDDVVGYGMFGGCPLRSVTLPDNAVKVEQNAFTDCHRLTSITLPSSASEITPSDNCPALSSISVSKANSSYSSVDGVLFNADVSMLVWFPLGKEGTYSLPKTLTSIGDYALRGCSVTSFLVPEGITDIGIGAFADSKVRDVSLPSTLRAVNAGTFQNCHQLSTVKLGSSTELISEYAFSGCPLSAIYLDAAIPPVCRTTAFSSYDATVYVPSASVAIYRAHSLWSKFRIRSL